MTINVYAPFGMKPVQNGVVRKVEYYLPTTDSDTYAIGSPMALAVDSNTNTLVNAKTALPGQYKNAVKATGGAGNLLLGAIVGFDSPPTEILSASSGYRPASQERVAIIADHPDQLFEIQASGLVSTDIGKNANITIGAPNATTKVDGSFLALPSAVTANFQVRIMDIKTEIGNTLGAENTQVAIVRINQHAYADGSVGV